MLSKVLTKETCKNCKFCCVFKKESLWELPVFPKQTYERIIAKNKDNEQYFNRIEDNGQYYGK